MIGFVVSVALKVTDVGHMLYRRYSSKEMILAIEYDGKYLRFASKQLQNDRRLVKAAVVSDGKALKYASKEL